MRYRGLQKASEQKLCFRMLFLSKNFYQPSHLISGFCHFTFSDLAGDSSISDCFVKFTCFVKHLSYMKEYLFLCGKFSRYFFALQTLVCQSDWWKCMFRMQKTYMGLVASSTSTQYVRVQQIILLKLKFQQFC